MKKAFRKAYEDYGVVPSALVLVLIVLLVARLVLPTIAGWFQSDVSEWFNNFVDNPFDPINETELSVISDVVFLWALATVTVFLLALFGAVKVLLSIIQIVFGPIIRGWSRTQNFLNRFGMDHRTRILHLLNALVLVPALIIYLS